MHYVLILFILFVSLYLFIYVFTSDDLKGISAVMRVFIDNRFDSTTVGLKTTNLDLMAKEEYMW